MLVGAGNQGPSCVSEDVCKDGLYALLATSSSPTATRRPPEESGILVITGEADSGSGFLLTGGWPLNLDVCAWNAVKDGTSLEGDVNGFTRVDEEYEFVELRGATSSLSDFGRRPRSMTTVPMTRS